MSAYSINMPGAPVQAVDLATLQMWARNKQIRADTMVQDTATGVTYMAKQIPGVFSDKEYIVALLLSLFLGYLGVDRFYTGHIGLGIGKLLTFGGCGIWALIDFILYAVRSVNDVNGRPLS
jgi:TM2 domain-containing membrane protein YozV